MPGLNPLPQNREMITNILDTRWSPVAKFRLLSGGVSPNHLLEGADNIAGQKACLACGNCVDACPVVLREEDKIDLQVHRTSLHLETIVDESCLRCYSCIKACPQVDRPLKLLAAKHRMTEKMVHWWMAAAYFLTAGTGIAINHFRSEWAQEFTTLVSIGHKAGAIMWLLAPILFFFFDRYHFNRTIKAVSSLGGKDVAWWKQAFGSVFNKQEPLFQGEYNTGHKTWYIIVLGTMLVLGATGIMRWFWEGNLSADTLSAIILIHVIAALVIDVSFIYHFGRKLLVRTVKRVKHIVNVSVPFNSETRQTAAKESASKVAAAAGSSQKVSG